jgi:hypothetical protein
MKIRANLLGLATIMTMLGAMNAACGQAPLSVVVNPTHDGVLPGGGVEKAGAPIFVLVELVNNSGKTLSTSQWDYAEYYTFDVRDADGKPVSETDALRDMRESLKPGQRRSGHGIVSQIKAGRTWKERIMISRYYDLSRPGTYTLQLERKLPDELGNGTMNLEKVTITVLPADDPPPQK